eukprot:gene9926-biopygen8305
MNVSTVLCVCGYRPTLRWPRYRAACVVGAYGAEEEAEVQRGGRTCREAVVVWLPHTTLCLK